MVPVLLALVSLGQLVLIFALEQSKLLRVASKKVFLTAKDKFDDIKHLFGDVSDTQESINTEAVLRVTELISRLFSSALNLAVGAAVAVAVAFMGGRTAQRPWMVASAYLAGGLCLVALVVLTVTIVIGQVQDHANWTKTPNTWLMRSVRNALSPRTPTSYKLIVLITSSWVLVISSMYVDPSESGPEKPLAFTARIACETTGLELCDASATRNSVPAESLSGSYIAKLLERSSDKTTNRQYRF